MPPTIERYRTALQRIHLSRPVKRAIIDGLISPSVTVFDYGCGRGCDLELLAAQGLTCSGWDPAFRPDAARTPADVVNLGFVLNVIEELGERAEALRRSWELAGKVLVVAAQVHVCSRGRTAVPYGDGVVTIRGTFQKFFDQGELKAYIEAELGTEAVPAEPGIFYVFRDDATREQFVANRFRRRVVAPRKRRSEVLYEENRELLDAFMEVLAEYGRLPDTEEWPRVAEVAERFGSLTKAHGLVRRIVGPDEWNLSNSARADKKPTIDELNNLVVREPVFVRDVATIREIMAPAVVYRINLHPAIRITVSPTKGESAAKVADKCMDLAKDALQDSEEFLVEDLTAK